MKTLGAYIVSAMLLLLALTLGYFALDWRSPDFAGYRVLALLVAIAVVAILVGSTVVVLRRLRHRRSSRIPAGVTVLAGVIALVALALVIVAEGRFQWMRYVVLNSDPDRLEALGQHFIVGYRDSGYVEALGERKAVAGFFITRHNIAGLDESAIRDEIRWLSTSLADDPTEPVWIATDQEGGGVARLSPPLPEQPALGQVLGEPGAGSSIEEVAFTYARRQAKGLASLGVNLNFAPVVDIDHQVDNPADRFTRISTRALSDDPEVVARAAGAYCRGLAEHGVRCTLKHFPGIGRVFNDTHVERAVLAESPQLLQQSDWVPFRQLSAHDSSPWIMLSHVIVPEIDTDQPVSTSAAVVQGLLRDQWDFDGMLITDDFCMRAIHDSPGGIGQATVDALNAGVDIVLVSYDPDQYYPAMYALLKADEEGRLNPARLDQSRARMERCCVDQDGK